MTSVQEYVVDAGNRISKVSPPVAVTALGVMGIPLQDWVYIFTIGYTILQIGWFIYTHFIRKDRRGDGS